MLIITFGLPGSGKSYFAERLAQKLSATYISSDILRKKISAKPGYSITDRLEVYNKMATEAGHVLKQQQPVVVDATFYSNQLREQFISLGTSFKVAVYLIRIVAGEETIK